jgi:hypothetical protein
MQLQAASGINHIVYERAYAWFAPCSPIFICWPWPPSMTAGYDIVTGIVLLTLQPAHAANLASPE